MNNSEKTEYLKAQVKSEQEAIARILESEDGKTLVHWLTRIFMDECGMPQSDPYKLAFLTGRRSVIISLLQMSQWNFSDMIQKSVSEDMTFRF